MCMNAAVHPSHPIAIYHHSVKIATHHGSDFGCAVSEHIPPCYGIEGTEYGLISHSQDLMPHLTADVQLVHAVLYDVGAYELVELSIL